ncbi:alanine racemase [Staphylococcus succinus]|uniref:Alanine racemase n=1 Tax=Staphylococcus succinus TaxID=61015 RepID=A0ABX5IM74_9STAP|nr:alanine racemase [Staphylococcus succinus]PTI68834.1 alanine racemase [Staphylococcus succinus]RIN35908.1 alanine racemase [Staphylococcus succinus]
MTATWSVDTEEFYKNAVNVAQDNSIMAVVKNNAYHYGLEFAVTQFLRAGIQTFSTTSLREAVRVREIAPTATIFLMNAVYDFDIVRDNHIHMTLPSLDFYYEHYEALYDIHIHLEFENLLHRSGLKSADEMRQVLLHHRHNENPNKMIIAGLWTHFGYADEFDVPDYHIERTAWLEIVNTLLDEGYQFPMIHAQNSASYYREDGVLPNHTHARIGIALYGSRPYSTIDHSMIKQALTVKGNIIQIREVNEGDYCGYSFAFEATHNHTKLAVVDVGYGDGILKSRAQFETLIHGKRYPIRALMMSHMFVEVDEQVHAQDEVILYNDDIRVDEFTFKGVGANSEQLSAMNHDSLIKEYR